MARLAPNALYTTLFDDPDTAACFTAGAELDAMIRVEIALARVQADLGVIPAQAGAAIAAHCTGLRIDPADLAEATGRNGVPVPALIAALRTRMGDDPGASHLHWGATSQDIMDSALALRLSPLVDLWQDRLDRVLAGLAALSGTHADLPMAARTYGQIATPTSFGAIAAGWGWPLLTHRRDLDDVRSRVLVVSLSGAAGTLSAMGPQGPAVRTALARALDLSDPGHGWHSDRSGPGRLADWCAGLAASLGKMAEDLLLMTQSGIALVRIDGAGASSTMPQKQNPVGPSALAALARHAMGLAATFRAAGQHRQSRDGAAWFTEWLTLPPLCMATGALLARAADVLSRLSPDAAAMARDLGTGNGTIYAEALTFAIAARTGTPRATVATAMARLCRRAQDEGCDLRDLAAQEWPGPGRHDLPDGQGLGTAPAEARDFHARITGARTG